MFSLVVLLLRLGSSFNLGSHVTGHYFLLDGVVAPEAEHLVGDLAQAGDFRGERSSCLLFSASESALPYALPWRRLEGHLADERAPAGICRSESTPGIDPNRPKSGTTVRIAMNKMEIRVKDDCSATALILSISLVYDQSPC